MTQASDSRRVYQQIADQVLQLIRAGEFAVNSRLPSERDLAEQFKVSRPSVREALIALEVMGFVQIKMGSGVYVCKPNPRKPPAPVKEFAPFELIQARALIEAEIAAQAAIHRTDAHLLELEQRLQDMGAQSAQQKNPLAADREFHTVLARATGNQVLASLVEQLFDARMGVLFSRLANYFDTQTTWEQAIKEHRTVLRAVKARDPERARAAMRHHMERAYKRFSVSWLKHTEPQQASTGLASTRLATTPRRARGSRAETSKAGSQTTKAGLSTPLSTPAIRKAGGPIKR
ncbi:MAG: FadR/GntR family transcriptional regulator [Zwartia sp.]